MAHIHIPDGIMPWWIWVPAALAVVGIVFLIIKQWDNEQARRLIPLTAMVAAIMLVTMSIPLFFVPVHLSLAILAGLMVGPKMAFLAILVVNVLLATTGHGGITLIGVNTLVKGLEMFVGTSLFQIFAKKLSTIPAAIAATVLGVTLSVIVSLSLVISTAGLAKALPHEKEDKDHAAITENIVDESIITLSSNNEVLASAANADEEHKDEDVDYILSELHYLGFSGWLAVIFIYLMGLAAESTATGFMYQGLKKIKKD